MKRNINPSDAITVDYNRIVAEVTLDIKKAGNQGKNYPNLEMCWINAILKYMDEHL